MLFHVIPIKDFDEYDQDFMMMMMMTTDDWWLVTGDWWLMMMCQVKIGKLIFHIADDGPLVVPPPVDLDLDLYLGVTTWVTSGRWSSESLRYSRPQN